MFEGRTCNWTQRNKTFTSYSRIKEHLTSNCCNSTVCTLPVLTKFWNLKKNKPQKLLIIGPKLFFHRTGPAAQTSPELIFHHINISQDSSLFISVYKMRVKYKFYEDQHRQLLGESNRKWKRVENIRSTQFWPSLYGWSSREPDEKGQQLFQQGCPSLLKTIKVSWLKPQWTNLNNIFTKGSAV